jgi:hypothetical protein
MYNVCSDSVIRGEHAPKIEFMIHVIKYRERGRPIEGTSQDNGESARDGCSDMPQAKKSWVNRPQAKKDGKGQHAGVELNCKNAKGKGQQESKLELHSKGLQGLVRRPTWVTKPPIYL